MFAFSPERRKFIGDFAQMAVGTFIAIDSTNKGQTNPTNMVPVEIDKYYPELSDKKITGRDNFRTEIGARRRVVNTTEFKFNPENAKKLFNYYELIARNGNISTSVDFMGQRIEYSVTPFPYPQDGVIFIIKGSDPLPSWALGDYQGVTDIRKQPSANITVVRQLPFQELSLLEQKALLNEVGFLTRTFAAEAANLSFVVRDRRGMPYRLGQETFINSLSRFVAARMAKVSYQDYFNSVNNLGGIIPNLGPIPFIPFPQRDYQMVSLPGAIFS